VHDAVSGSVYTDDLEDQPSNNYDYDEVGQLLKDDAECKASGKTYRPGVSPGKMV
jgi:hypothetical protein